MFPSRLSPIMLQYLNREIELRRLEDLLVPRLPAILGEEYSLDSALASSIELALAELSDGIRSEEEIRGLLFSSLWNVQQEHSVPPLTRPSFDSTSSANEVTAEPQRVGFAMTTAGVG